MTTSFAQLVADSLKDERFTLVDLGCAGGINPTWRVFGDRLRAVGFDADAEDCRARQSEETNPDVKYVAGFVGIPPEHPFARRPPVPAFVTRNFFPRVSAAWGMELRQERLKTASLQERRDHNHWVAEALADPNKPVYVPQTLQEMGYGDLDFMKIDIDGPDFLVMNSFDGFFDSFRLLAAQCEVNMCGGAGDAEHTFHNTDRFMRERGFDLFALEPRVYSMRALPSRFAITVPAQTETGRVLQAEAYYARDACADDQRDLMMGYGAEKIAKLAAILSIWNQPDGAAEILVKFRDTLAPLFDVDRALDLLVAQTLPPKAPPRSYAEHMALFAAESPEFFPPPHPTAPPKRRTLLQRLKIAHRAFYDPDNAFPQERETT